MKELNTFKIRPLAFIGQIKIWCTQRLYSGYLALISASGIFLLFRGVTEIPTDDSLLLFLLLILLVALSNVVTSSVGVGKSSVTYTICPAIALAAIPTFGPFATVIIGAVFNLFLWLSKPADEATWKRSWPQLAFNVGMHAIIIVASGWLLLSSQAWLGRSTIAGMILPWFVAGFVYEELNFWILAIVLRLQHGADIRLKDLRREGQWSIRVGGLVSAFGSGILAFAMVNYDWIGVAIFFLPILLSAYAFRLYVQQMQAHLDNLENIVSERTQELRDLNDEKDAFLAVLTHDMITPLTSIQMYGELIHAEPELILENPRLIQIMLRSQKTVSDLVRDILDIERVTSGGSLLTQKVPCNLPQMIADVIDIVQPEAEEKGIEIAYTKAWQPLHIDADRQQIQRVLLNLLANAIKYTQPSGKVTIELYQDGSHVLLAIQDTGYGIPPDELPHIFDRFKRVGQHKDKAIGTGLGLTISKALVEEHGGEIIVTSEVGAGSTFTVKLPMN